MATLNIPLVDSANVSVDFGDKVLVVLPEIDQEYGCEDDWFFMPQRIVEGIIDFQLSRGLTLKITKILEYDLEDATSHYYTVVGQRLSFRRTVWEWYKIQSGIADNANLNTLRQLNGKESNDSHPT